MPNIISTAIKKLAHLNELPAGLMDRIYLNERRNFLGNALDFAGLRLVYLTLFLPATIVSTLASGLIGALNGMATFGVSDELQERVLGQQKTYATLFSKNLWAIVASPAGLISPKLVAFYFTPEKLHEKGVDAGGSLYHADDAECKAPKDEDELAAFVRSAARNHQKVMPKGAGRSQGKQFLPAGKNGVVIDLTNFNTIEINKENKTAKVGSGVRWADLQVAADKHKLALKVMQASNVFSVGGSIGTNIHGWDHHSGMLSNTILSIDIINAQGEKQTLQPDDELFHHITGGLGLFGVVTSVTLQLQDNVKVVEKGVKVVPADYVKYFREQVQADSTIRMHLYRLSLNPDHLLGEGVSTNYVCEEDRPCITEPRLKIESSTGTRLDKIMVNLARRFNWVRARYWHGERDRILANTAPSMTMNATMQPPINAMFNTSVSEAEWLQEYFVPGENLNEFLQALSRLLMRNDVVLLNASVRFVKQNNKSPFSYAHTGDRFAVVLCFNQSLQSSEVVKASKWLRESQHLVVQHGGSYYLPYQHVSSPDDFEHSYPGIKEAKEMKERVDPDHVFASGLSEKFMDAPAVRRSYFYDIMASDESRQRFSGFLKNVLCRVDADKFYQLLENVMTYKDSHAEIYEELCRRLPEVVPGTFGTLNRILSSLSTIKHDLDAQAVHLLGKDTKEIDGLVEIGYPGRFVGGFKKHYQLKGTVAAVYEGRSITDYVQTGFPRPYNKFAKLDYNNPDLAILEDNSADVVTCYVGLHHFPTDKLGAFLKDVRRVLRDGGRFLLVDHDVVNDEAMAMAHMAHTVFNAVNGISLDEEMTERRLFRPMSEWVKELEKHGLACGVEGPEVPLIREGDPSRNRMMSFVKGAPVLILRLVPAPAPAAEPPKPVVATSKVRRHLRKGTGTHKRGMFAGLAVGGADELEVSNPDRLKIHANIQLHTKTF